jgi:hypothetical protein
MSVLRVGKQVQGVSVSINKQNNKHETQTMYRYETESITPEERSKGSDRYRGDNQGGEGVQVSVMRRWCT